MSARVLILAVEGFGLIWRLVKMRLADLQRGQPLPPEVADVYDAARYRKYLDYVADNRRAALVFGGIRLALTALLWLSGLFATLEGALGGNPYLTYLATCGIFLAAETALDTVAGYYDTFHIEEKYGLNRQSIKGFAKDTALDLLLEVFLMGGLGLLFVFIGEHMAAWTKGFSVGPAAALLITAAITAAVSLFALLSSLLSLWVFKKQYTFTPMPEGELRAKIMALQEGSKKKVRLIYVYDESKKSTTKNAFLLKLLWHREFGIADNFMSENAEEELLAVLSHEIGHLKHKKNLLNYIGYAYVALVFAAVAGLIWQPSPVLRMNAWVRASFSLTANNYYVLLGSLSALLTPVLRISGTFDRYRSRQEEYEADREAVRNGYGEALIGTFKKLSSDELVNVNPHPVIEFMEYGHPGMAQRIRAIRQAEKALADIR